MSVKNHFESIEAAKSYAEEHPELNELIYSFIRMSEHPKTMCKIEIGKYNAKSETFIVNLISNVRFAKTLFTFYKEKPQILIRNHSENVCLFNLTDITKILYQQKHSVPKPLDYERETYIFSHLGNDYRLTITFELSHI